MGHRAGMGNLKKRENCIHKLLKVTAIFVKGEWIVSFKMQNYRRFKFITVFSPLVPFETVLPPPDNECMPVITEKDILIFSKGVLWIFLK
jgi:hypothetical protein